MGCKTVAFQVSRQITAGNSTYLKASFRYFKRCNVVLNQVLTDSQCPGNCLRITLFKIQILKLGRIATA